MYCLNKLVFNTKYLLNFWIKAGVLKIHVRLNCVNKLYRLHNFDFFEDKCFKILQFCSSK